jgi:hypothetical protein
MILRELTIVFHLELSDIEALDGGEGVLGGYREYCPLSEVDGGNHYFVHLHVQSLLTTRTKTEQAARKRWKELKCL